jgi:transposase-like protein
MQEQKIETTAEGERGKEEPWSERKARRVLRDLDQSGEPVAHYARRHGWTPQRLHFWMTKLGWRRSRPAAEPSAPAKEGPRFVPVHIVPDRPAPGVAAPHLVSSGVVIELGRGRRICVTAAFDQEVLRQVLTVLEEGAPC